MTNTATILCVEDEVMLLEDLKEELEDAGYRVLSAENGKAALDILGEQRPNLILCDMMMPQMDGAALLKEIRSNHRKLNDVPFIFLTAKATRDDLIEGKRLGVDDYLTKPVDYDLLLATVEASLAQIERIDDRNKQKLRQLYRAFQKQLKRPADRHIRVMFVTGNPTGIKPLTDALIELGCEVSVVSEDQLARKSFSLEQVDILFLVYSKTVHYYLKYMTEEKPKEWKGETVLLAPSKMSWEMRSAIMQSGIDDHISYPYPPVEVFKLIMKRIQSGEKSA
jgi:DNA-binding response OmpR family regulator